MGRHMGALIFRETMGGHDSYRETFTSWAATTKETKGEGSDHRGEFRIGYGGRGQVNLQYTMGGGGHVCKDTRQIKESIYTRKK